MLKYLYIRTQGLDFKPVSISPVSGNTYTYLISTMCYHILKILKYIYYLCLYFSR